MKSIFSRLLLRLIQEYRIFKFRLISNLAINGRPILNQPLHAVGHGSLTFLGKVNIGVFPSPGFTSTHAYIEARNAATSITIGDGTWINNGFVAIAEQTKIIIGKRCLIGSNCEILDSDFHALHASERADRVPPKASPILLGDDVFLGSNVTVLKGVTIGQGAVVANGSVVTRNVPPFTVVGGNPAGFIKQLNELTDSQIETVSEADIGVKIEANRKL